MKHSEEISILKKDVQRLTLKIYKLNQSIKQIRKTLVELEGCKRLQKKSRPIKPDEDKIRMRNLLM